VLIRSQRRRAGWLVVAGVAAGALLAPAASAHAMLTGSDPAPGASVRGGQPIALRFSEDVDLAGSRVVLNGPGGTTSALTPLGHRAGDAASLVATIPDSLAPGGWTIEWRVTAADDGHATAGAIPVSIGAAAVAKPAPGSSGHPAGEAPGVSGLFSLVRMLSYLALFVLCGGGAFIAAVWPAGADAVGARRLLWAAWALAGVTTLLGIGWQGAIAAHRGAGAVFDLHLFNRTLQTTVGRVWATRALLLVIAAPVLGRLRGGGAAAVRSIGWRVGAAAVAVGLLRTPGLVGHASEGRDAWAGSVADLVHVGGLAIWLGGLAVLAIVVLPRRRIDELEHVVSRFSSIAFFAVAAMASAGAFLAWQLVGGWHGLVATRFGHVLLVKMAVFAGLLVAARSSKQWVDKRLDLAVLSGADTAVVRPFVYSVVIEATLALAVLSAASVLVATSPAR